MRHAVSIGMHFDDSAGDDGNDDDDDDGDDGDDDGDDEEDDDDKWLTGSVTLASVVH